MLLRVGSCLVLIVLSCAQKEQDGDPLNLRSYDERTVTLAIGNLGVTFGKFGGGLFFFIPTLGWQDLPSEPRRERSVATNTLDTDNETNVSERFFFQICDKVIDLFFHKTPLRDIIRSKNKLGAYTPPKTHDHDAIVMQPSLQQIIPPGIPKGIPQALLEAILQGYVSGGQQLPNLDGTQSQPIVIGQQQPIFPGLQLPLITHTDTFDIDQQKDLNCIIQEITAKNGNQKVNYDGDLQAIINAFRIAGKQVPSKVMEIEDGSCDLCNEPVQVLPNPASVITVVQFLMGKSLTFKLLKEFFQTQKYFLPYESTPFPGYATFLEFIDAYIPRVLSIPEIMDDAALSSAFSELKAKIPRNSLIGPLT